MEVFSAPRFILSNAYGSLGSRLVGLGLALAFRRQGKSLACAVRGSEITHAARYRRIAGRVVRCLDDSILSEDQTVNSLADLAIGSDIILVEGSRGLFDSPVPGSLRGTDAELARLARIPVILVVDGKEIGAGVAPLIKGYSEFVPGLNIDGVILYNCRETGGFDAQFLRESLQLARAAPLIGCLPPSVALRF